MQALERERSTSSGSARERLTASLAEGERTRRIAEQRAHAEQALRRDLARQLASGEREVRRAREALGELATAEDRIRVLEDQLTEVRRRSDEAEQAGRRRDRGPSPRRAPGARAIRRRRAGPRLPSAPGCGSRGQLRRRQAASWVARAGRAGCTPPPLAAAPEPPAPEPIAAAVRTAGAAAPCRGRPCAARSPRSVAPAPPTPAPAPSGLVDTLRRELDARAASDAALRSRVVAAETRLAARVLLDQRTAATLAELRTELDGLRAALERERARREIAERGAAELSRERDRRVAAERRTAELEQQLGGQRERSRDAYDAIGELRGALERLRPPVPSEPESADPEVAAAVARARSRSWIGHSWSPPGSAMRSPGCGSRWSLPNRARPSRRRRTLLPVAPGRPDARARLPATGAVRCERRRAAAAGTAAAAAPGLPPSGRL